MLLSVERMGDKLGEVMDQLTLGQMMFDRLTFGMMFGQMIFDQLTFG
jgi:hypothetical protein